MYFKRQVELSTMYRTMEGHNYDTPEDAILAVKSGLVILFADVCVSCWESNGTTMYEMMM